MKQKTFSVPDLVEISFCLGAAGKDLLPNNARFVVDAHTHPNITTDIKRSLKKILKNPQNKIVLTRAHRAGVAFRDAKIKGIKAKVEWTGKSKSTRGLVFPCDCRIVLFVNDVEISTYNISLKMDSKTLWNGQPDRFLTHIWKGQHTYTGRAESWYTKVANDTFETYKQFPSQDNYWILADEVKAQTTNIVNNDLSSVKNPNTKHQNGFLNAFAYYGRFAEGNNFLVNIKTQKRPEKDFEVFEVSGVEEFSKQENITNVWAELPTSKQPSVTIVFEVENIQTKRKRKVVFFVEIRWSHGKNPKRNPEAKIHLVTPYDQLPYTKAIC